MSDLNEKFATCYTTMDPAEAKVIRSYLESYGIQCFLPDENLTDVAWHLTGAVGGVRVQVLRTQLDEAKTALENFSSVDDENPDNDEKEINPVVPNDFAKRALRTAIIGMVLWPILHPYAVYLALRAIGNWRDLTTGERIEALFVLIFSSLNIAGAIILIYQNI